MKKYFIILSCVFFINSTLDSENIELDIERLGENSVQISWSINYDEYDRIVLEVLNQNNSERTRYILPSLKGVVELCCFEGDVGATITVTKSKAVDKSDEDCNALTCIEYVKEDYFNSKIVTAYQPTTTTTSTTTTTIPPTTTTSTTTTTTTVPPPIIEEETLLNIEITNALITSIPLFEDIDFTDQEKNSMGVIVTTGIIVLFYLVLLLQEWFSKIISTYRIRWFTRDKEFLQSNKLVSFIKISFVLIITSFLISYVEEGATLTFSLENLAIFLAAFVGLVAVTLSYEGVEGFIERNFFGEVVYYKWAPQAILFALISTVTFILFNMPIGFIFGFIASSYVVSTRVKATLSPKFFSSIALSLAGFIFFYLTSLSFVTQSALLTAICALTYLMCLEGVLFKSLPGGGNELLESINDSEGVFKIFPLFSFVISVWLFIRILIIPPDSEFATFQQDLLSMGSFSLTFGIMLIIYIFGIFILGTGIKVFGDNE